MDADQIAHIPADMQWNLVGTAPTGSGAPLGTPPTDAVHFVTSIHIGIGSGKILFGVGIGLITVVIRLWGAYPEGVSFAILIMNAFTPLINKAFKPKVFGVVKPSKK